mgnify:CR=1 FL=1
MYLPSYDFSLFDVQEFSPLQMQEYGAQTTFGASDPVDYVVFSINQLRNIVNPNSAMPYRIRQFPTTIFPDVFPNYFQSESASTTRERLQRVRDEADRLLNQAGGANAPTQEKPASKPTSKKGCSLWDLLTFNCTPAWMTKSGDAEAGAGVELKSSDDILGKGSPFGNIPAGAGVFIIAILAIIFLLLFARR